MLQLKLSKDIRRFGWLGNYYEFGCFRGGSLIMCGQLIEYYSIFYNQMFENLEAYVSGKSIRDIK